MIPQSTVIAGQIRLIQAHRRHDMGVVSMLSRKHSGKRLISELQAYEQKLSAESERQFNRIFDEKYKKSYEKIDI